MELDHRSLVVRNLTRSELDVAVEWAAQEGWNPGLHDAEVFWNTDPEGFLGIAHEGELIATGSVVTYGARYGFMGFFIVRPDLRGRGIGTHLWFHRRDHLRSRLGPDGAIGMDGVFAMQDWYARGGFAFSHRNLRMAGTAQPGKVARHVAELSDAPFSELLAYDHHCFGCRRERFLEGWLALPESHALGVITADGLAGYGVVRRCREGHKIGPLYADTPELAEDLLAALCNRIAGEPFVLDIPENNPAAVELAERHHLEEVFGCARMYLGTPPVMDWDRTFGITTFELG